ncbi:hypothetical protein ACE6H2_002870 [Prunus campanulata]
MLRKYDGLRRSFSSDFLKSDSVDLEVSSAETRLHKVSCHDLHMQLVDTDSFTDKSDSMLRLKNVLEK